MPNSFIIVQSLFSDNETFLHFPFYKFFFPSLSSSISFLQSSHPVRQAWNKGVVSEQRANKAQRKGVREIRLYFCRL